MTYSRNSNPLENVKVELPRTCANRNHWESLIIWGKCETCKREWGLGSEEGKVFARLAQVKEQGV